MGLNLLILGTDGQGTNILYHALKDEVDAVNVILERRQNRWELVRKRLKKFPVSKVFGQLFFQVLMMPMIETLSQSRRAEIFKKYKLDPSPIPESEITWISSVNSRECYELVTQYKPNLVLLSGTRILSKETIASISCPIVNLHAGITPLYRGVHGAYWALTENDPDNCGVTLHFVNAGIDTGQIISQQVISPEERDNFSTYPLLQLAAGIELMKLHFNKIHSVTSKIDSSATKGKLWYHPTAWEYLKNRWRRGIK